MLKASTVYWFISSSKRKTEYMLYKCIKYADTVYYWQGQISTFGVGNEVWATTELVCGYLIEYNIISTNQLEP